jgi:hypothetical protein
MKSPLGKAGLGRVVGQYEMDRSILAALSRGTRWISASKSIVARLDRAFVQIL